MKNIAISALFAKASVAQLKHKAEMFADRAEPSPILIAASYDLGGNGHCSNTAVEGAVGAVSTAQGTLDNTKKDATTKDALDKQLGLKKVKDGEVTKANTDMATLLDNDNKAQLLEYNFKKLWVASYQLWKAAKDAEDKQSVVVNGLDADLKAAKLKETEVKQSYLDAKGNMAQRKKDLEGEKDGSNNFISGKEGVTELHRLKDVEYKAEFAKIAPEQKIFDDLQVKLDTEKIAWQWAKLAEDQAKAAKVEFDKKVVLAEKDLLEATNPSPAKAVKDAIGVLDASGGAGADYIAKQALFVTAMKTAVSAMKAWMDLDGTAGAYLDTKFGNTLGANFKCGGSGVVCVADATAANLAACTKLCTDKPPWSFTNKLPIKALAASAAICTGFHYGGVDKCGLCHTKVVEKGAGASAYNCYARAKSVQAAIDLIVDKNALGTGSGGGGTRQDYAGKVDAYWAKYKTDVYPKTLLLDQAKSYEVEIKKIQTTNDTAITKVTTGLTAVKQAAFDKYDATDKLMIASRDKLKGFVSKTAGFDAQLKALEYKKTIETKENTNYAKIEADLKQREIDVIALVGASGPSGLTKKLADAQGVLGASVAAGLKKATADADGAAKAAKKKYTDEISKAKGTADAMNTKLLALNKLLGEAAALDAGDVLGAQQNYDAWVNLCAKQKKEVADKEVLKVAAIVTCEAEKYNEYAQALSQAEQARKEKIDKIVKLLDDRAKPAKGAAGWRCEKALSNGTFRPKRNEKTCGTDLCCGAAKVTTGNLVMTIETCQSKTAKTYEYTKPRTPLAVSWTKVPNVPFACISGAQKLVTAASALAAAVYMMA